ncbi:MAG: o-succinylbenzoate synthase [Actinomycetota bacterium]
MIEIKHAELIRVDLPLVRPFRTSFGIQEVRKAVLLYLECKVDGTDSFGWGECVAGEHPDYSSEWGDGAWDLLRDVLVPRIVKTGIADSLNDARFDRLQKQFAFVKGNPMAKATLENALIDAALRSRGESLKHWLGRMHHHAGSKDRVECGVSIGMTNSTEELLDQIAGYLAEGYRRIKLKIEPGNDIEIVRPAREKFPEVMMTVDANQSYRGVTPERLELFKALDEYSLAFIEQPFAKDNLKDHAELAAQIKTPICLDESITDFFRADRSIRMGAASVLNIKQGRMGGIENARRVAIQWFDPPIARGAKKWIGGMLETGIGRAVNLALASVETITLPGDTSASKRYFAEDITPPFEMDPDGTIAVPDSPGIGVEPIPELLKKFTARKETIPL